MKRFGTATLCIALILVPAGCKLIKNVAEDERAIPADASGDDARTQIRIDETFEAKLVPFINEKALSVSELRAAMSGGLDKAGEIHATRGSGEGAAWNFSLTDSGVIVEAKLDSRARTVGVDTDSDGNADATIQLGPVIKGTALRDVAPFYNFDEFRDQIEFAKLARALNDKISGGISLPEGDVVGKTVRFTGVAPFKSTVDPAIVTPIYLDVSQ